MLTRPGPNPGPGLDAQHQRSKDHIYESPTHIAGLPLYSNGPVAQGIIAGGGRATGVIALGGIAAGLIAFGGLTLGVISIGGLYWPVIHRCRCSRLEDDGRTCHW